MTPGEARVRLVVLLTEAEFLTNDNKPESAPFPCVNRPRCHAKGAPRCAGCVVHDLIEAVLSDTIRLSQTY